MQDWLKLHTDLLDNPDVALMSAEDYQIATFLWMLCRKEGFTDGRLIGWDFARLAYRFRKSVDHVTAAVTSLSRPEINWCNVDVTGMVSVVKYTERQYGSKSASPDAIRERVKRHRNKAKSDSPPLQPIDSNEHVTRRNGVIEEKREEESRKEESTGASAPRATLPDDPLQIDLTPSGLILLRKYDQLAARAGKTSKVKRYKNDQQRQAFEAVYRVLNGELETLIDKGFAHDRTRVTDMLSWLEGCVKRANEQPQIVSKRSGKQSSDEEDRAAIRAVLERRNGKNANA